MTQNARRRPALARGGVEGIDLLGGEIVPTNSHNLLRAQAMVRANETSSPLSGIVLASKPALTAVQSRRLREEADDYPHVVVMLSNTERVIECRDHIQWITQERIGCRWRSQSFCRSKSGLLGHASSKSEIANAILQALPDWIEARP